MITKTCDRCGTAAVNELGWVHIEPGDLVTTFGEVPREPLDLCFRCTEQLWRWAKGGDKE